MRKILGILLLLGGIIGALFATDNKPQFPYPHYVTYHNALTLSNYSQKTLAKNVALYYERWKREFLISDKALYRIATDKIDTSRTVSEGQGYGMMIVALMAGYDKDAKKIFDGLWHFVKKNPSEICAIFMTWQVPDKKGESDSAFDGDADIAYALLLASAQWGDMGEINYKKEATIIIEALADMMIGRSSYLPLLGDWVQQNGKKYNQYTTRSSDFMLSHFRAFYRFSGDKKWLNVIKETQKALVEIQAYPHNKTTLVSDFIYHDKHAYHPTKEKFLEEKDDAFYYNACRVPLRVGLDALLNADIASRSIVKKMSDWISKESHENPDKIMSGYRLTGQVIGAYNSAVFVAPFGVSLKLDSGKQEFFDKIYEAIKERHENYFEDSINLLSQLIMIDAFWDPSTVR